MNKNKIVIRQKTIVIDRIYKEVDVDMGDPHIIFPKTKIPKCSDRLRGLR